MAEDMSIHILLVTANVGSIFEDPHQMLKSWISEFLKTCERISPQFIALHCQEIGGKNAENSMKNVEEFVRSLMESLVLTNFDKMIIFLDEDYTNDEKFTALGSFYFIHEDIKCPEIWDFQAGTFIGCSGRQLFSGNIEEVVSKEKVKFSAEFFPECKWSRKGYMRTRWRLHGTVFDLINIHLFHDASNFLSIKSFPSVYASYRRKALEFVLDRMFSESEGAQFFIFGDFNFRCDTEAVVKGLTSHAVAQYVKSNKNGDPKKIIYTDEKDDNKILLTLGKKEFDPHNNDALADNGWKWLKEFDRELHPFKDRLLEHDITFPPSYPFCEELESANCYMKTRCPSWCDRILFSRSTSPLIVQNQAAATMYNVIGTEVCMGDHKPVYLSFNMTSDPSGIHPCILSIE